MSETLYRKYRPQDFTSIIGQNHIKITLQKAVANEKISHAYLFTGPRGVGKTTSARVLAKAINCKNPTDGEPCNDCDICLPIMQGNFLDVVELDAASRRKIDEIKEFKEHIKYPPNIAKYKIFIIDEVHMLTEVSFSALLKTLEEPPEHSIFILCTTAIHKIPETIISRCQRFDFKKISAQDIISNLKIIANQEKVKIDDKIYQTIARLAEGSLRDAQGMLNQIVSLGEKEVTWDDAALLLPRSDIDLTIKFWQYLMTNQPAEAISLIDKIIDEGVDIFYFADELLELMRNLLLLKIDKKLDRLVDILPKERYQELYKQLQNVNIDWLKESLDIMLKRRQDLKFCQIEQLPLELAVIEITSLLKSDLNDHSTDKQIPAGKIEASPTESPPKPMGNTNSSSKSLNEKINKQLIDKISASNFSLAGILRSSTLKTNGNTLVIEVTHNFHKEQIDKNKNIDLILKSFETIMGDKFNISSMVVETQPEDKMVKKDKTSVKPDNYVEDIISAFGGKVVESGIVEE